MAHLIFTVVIVLTAALIDFKTMKIPNWLILIGLIGGIGIGIYDHLSIKEWLMRVAVIICIFALGYLRMLGMGDIKLWIVLTLLLGGIWSSLIICISSVLLIVYAVSKDKKNITTVFVSANDVLMNKKINKDIMEINKKGYPLAVFMVIPTLIITVLGIIGLINV